MGFWNNFKTGFPFSNLHSLNLDWILSELERLQSEGLTLVSLSDKLKALTGSNENTAKNADKLGGKLPAEYLGANATAKDSEKLNGKDAVFYIQPKNLLDNSNFTKPINQRGLNVYTGAGQYTIDRWKTFTANAEISIVADGLSIKNDSLFQYNELSLLQAGVMYTGAIGYSNGEVFCASFDGAAGIGTNESPFKSGHDAGKSFFRINPSANTISWVALYEGEYSADNLPPYMPKDYTVELAECQRYYENSWFVVGKNSINQTTALAWSAESCEGEFRFSTEKRAVPTMKAYPSSSRTQVSVYNQGYMDCENTQWLMRSGVKGAWLRATFDTNVLEANMCYGLHAHWEASADY